MLNKYLARTNSWSWRLSRGENTVLVCYCRKDISNKAHGQQDADPQELTGVWARKGGLGNTVLLS